MQVKQLKAQIKERDERIARLKHDLWAKSAENFEPKDGPVAQDETGPDSTGQGNNVPDAQKSSDGCGCGKSPKNYAADPQKPKKASTGRGPTDWNCFDHFTLKYNGPLTCPCGCGGPPRSFNPEKRLHCRPVYYWVDVTYVPKFRCRYDHDGEERMKTMPFAATLLPGTNISSSVLAYHATQRYAWGLPWYRIETMMRYAGWMVYRSTLMRRANKTAEAIMGVYYALMESVLGDSIRVFVDETPIPILRPGKGKTGTAYFFAVHRDDQPFGGSLPPATLYTSRGSRAGYHVHDLFAGRSLIAHHDGYGGYGKFGTVGSAVENVVSVGCWTHSRRNFIKYYETTKSDGRGSASAAEIIEMIDLIYKYDGETWGWSPEKRRRHRQEYCKPIIDKLRRRLDEIKATVSAGNRLTKAINYVLNRWDGLTRFLDDGRIELDTNAVERQFKPIQNLRKNVYFMGSDEGGQAWAVFSSLIETCKLNGVDPYKYLVWMFDELALLFGRGAQPVMDYRKFLPWNAPEKCAVGFKAEDEGMPRAA
ncbi:IS66 family transposase [Loktanella sp. S4079]|uniref:IS66 family transposase n=1 Tax=Loktanella sp. S4079 TaxID=579483 RepID=UPI0005F9A9B3|nr:IS66 family transposase [Loktanella sp. S4079]KJZ17240.1 hypothetical protein TW80_17105 [Loktanella sp. S4079]